MITLKIYLRIIAAGLALLVACGAGGLSRKAPKVPRNYRSYTILKIAAAIGLEKPVYNFLGHSYQEGADRYRAVSPVTYISPDDPLTMIFHGTIDETVPVDQSNSLKAKPDAARVPNEYHRLRGRPHAMDIGVSVNRYCQHYMNAFFEQYLPFSD